MKKLPFIMIVSVILWITVGSGPTMGGEMDILIEKLVEKNILTRSEARELISEIQKEASKKEEGIKKAAAEAAKEEVKSGIKIPEWIEKIKFSGDFRLRYQAEDIDNDKSPHRSRGVIRLRAGVDSKINEHWDAGFGITSGGSNPRSTNQTLDNVFETKNLMLDYALSLIHI